MNQFENTMSMNSLMDCIYGTNNTQTFEYSSYFLENNIGIEEIPNFMEQLMNHLIEFCLTNSAIEHAQSKLIPLIKQYSSITNKNPKLTLEHFLQVFVELLNQQITKMRKLKKNNLQYLIKTVTKQIFTKIMRLSCELKIENINRNNSEKAVFKKKNNIILLTSILSRAFAKDIASGFKNMKINYQSSIKCEEELIQNLSESIQKMDYLCRRKKKIQKQKAMELWRRKTAIAGLHETQSIINITTEFQSCIIDEVIGAWQVNQKDWFLRVIHQMHKLIKANFSDLKGVMVQFYSDHELSEEKSISFNYSHSNISSHRSNISLQSLQSQIMSCIGKSDIKYDHDHNSAMIPINAIKPIGVIVITWDDVMSLTLFHRILRILEIIKQIVEHLYQLGTRLNYHISKYQQNQWQANSFEMYNSSLNLSTSERFEKISSILQNAEISYLELYHDRNSQEPCLTYGQHEPLKLQKNVYDQIWQKLQHQSCFSLDRGLTKYRICLIEYGERGFCRYLTDKQGYSQEQSSLIINNTIPLILQCHENSQCQDCRLFIRKTKQEIENQKERIRTHRKLNQLGLSQYLRIETGEHIEQIEQTITEYLSTTFPEIKLFSKIFYCLDEDHSEYAYLNHKASLSRKIQALTIPKSIAMGQIYDYSPNKKQAIVDSWTNLIKALQSSPIFDCHSPTLYVYEREKTIDFRVMSYRIGRKALLVMGTYESDVVDPIQQQFAEAIQKITNLFNKNQKVFEKVDGQKWAHNLVNQSSVITMPDLSMNKKVLELAESNKNSNEVVAKAVQLISQQINIFDSLYIWKIKQKGLIDKKQIIELTQNIDGKKEINIDWQYLLDEPLLSHQRVAGTHSVLRKSKNYGFTLKTVSTYIPNFNDNSTRFDYASRLLQRMQSYGDLTDSSSFGVAECLRKMISYDKHSQNFLSIPIPFESSSKKATILIIATFTKKILMNQNIFQTLTNYYQQMILIAISTNRHYFKAKQPKLLKDVLIGQWKQKQQRLLVRSVKAFATNYHLSLEKMNSFLRATTTIKYNLEYRAKRSLFKSIKGQYQEYKDDNKSAMFYLSQKIVKIFGIGVLYKVSAKRKSIIRGASKTQLILRSIYLTNGQSRVNIKTAFMHLQQSNMIAEKTVKNMKRQACRLLNHLTQQIRKRNSKELFRINFRIKSAMARDLCFIKQEFKIMGYKGIRAALKFLDVRLNIVLSQYYLQPLNIDLKYQNTNHLIIVPESIIKSNQTSINNSRIVFEINSVAQSPYQEPIDTHLKRTIEKFLKQFIPEWQQSIYIPYLRQNSRIMMKVLKVRYDERLSHFFAIVRHNNFQSSYKSFKKMEQEAGRAKEQMLEYIEKEEKQKKSCNGREQHKKKMFRLNQRLEFIENEGMKLELQQKIKKKTNSAYLIQRILQHKKFKQFSYEDSDQKQNFGFSPNFMKETLEEISTIQKSTACMKRVQILKILPLWVKKINKMVRNMGKQSLFEASIRCLHHLIHQ